MKRALGAVLPAYALLSTAVFAEPAMWVIRDPDSTIYLVGTVHLLRHEMHWNSPKLNKALAESSELWLEVANSDDQFAIGALIQQYGVDNNKHLSEKLPPGLNDKLMKVCKQYDFSRASLELMRPWLAALTFSVLPLQKAGYDPNAGVDQTLKKEAEKKGERISGFETMEEQVRLLADLPEPDQMAMLQDSLKDAAKGIPRFDKLATAWIDGDTGFINDLLIKEMKAEAPQLYQKLLVERNIRWAEKIDGILKGSGVQLIAVGAAHLVGPDSVQVQLGKRGIKVDPF